MPGIFDRLRYLFTGRARQSQVDASKIRPLSRIDAAQTSDENRKHWANADAFGPNAAYDDATRAILRNRGRYETVNNSYLKGLVRGLAYDLIGTGPRPQISFLNGDPRGLARVVEMEHAKWARAVKLARKLRTLHKQACRDGAGLIAFDSRPNGRVPVEFYPRSLEIDLLGTPFELATNLRIFGGIEIDAAGEAIAYYLRRQHPGETSIGLFGQTFTRIPADRVVHWYLEDRAGQLHGIPEITAALPIAAILRRYGLATLSAAEFASMLAGVMKTTSPPGGEAVSVENWNLVEMVRGALMAVPAGWEPLQFKPEQPTTNYPEFERTKLQEAGRSCGAPLSSVTGNNNGSSFSSGRMDHLPYQAGHWIDRDDFQTIVYDPLFREWAKEAIQSPGYLPAGLPPFEEWQWSLNWDGFPEIDQVKAAEADDKRLRNGSATLGGIWAERDGANWRQKIDELAEEIAYCREKGVPHPLVTATAPPTATSTAPSQPADPEQQDQENDGEDQPDPEAFDLIPERDPVSNRITRLRRAKPSRNGKH